MEIRNFMNKNNLLSYDQLKEKLYKKYKLKTNIDKSDNYYMISTTNECDFSDLLVRQSTGIVIDKKTNNILHYFGEKTYDIVNKYNNNIINLKNINFKNCYISNYIDGYIIKIFNYEGKWKFATSKHTNIKYFKTEDKILYNIVEKSILKLFDNINDFLHTLDNDYCYTFMLNNNNFSIINKIKLKTLNEEFNCNNYISLHKYKYNKKNEKFIIVEKNDKKEIVNKIHISINDIKDELYKNILCKYNNKCFDITCKLIHIIEPDKEENYKSYINLEKKKNMTFKTKNCKNNNDCMYHLKNKCKYIHKNDPIH
jgi:hypothetical protein